MRRKGFTLIELLVVMMIIGSLLAVAVPRYFHSLERAKEASLRQDLATMRDALDKFAADKGRYPDTLAELVDARYLRALPQDPVAGPDAQWVLVPSDDADTPGVKDVHSAAAGKALDGSDYATW